MLTTPRTAEEAFRRLAPDIDELSDCISNSVVGREEQARLANLVAAHFVKLAGRFARPPLRLVVDRSNQG